MTDPRDAHPPPGLCEQCAHARRITSPKGSVFWMCRHPELPKYPQLPVLQCSGFRAARDEATE